MKILAVDDDPFILDLLKDVIAQFDGHDLLTVESAAAALSTMNEVSDIDCFLVDIQMPEKDGVSLCRDIRQHDVYERTPIMMLTAMAERHYIDSAFAAGATDYINKPFEVHDLESRLNTVMSMLEKRRSEAERIVTTASGRRVSERISPVKLYEPFEIHDVDGVLAPIALENYVTKLTRTALFGSSVFALSIRQIDQHYADLSPFDFQSMIVDVAEALSDQLNMHQFLMTYTGSGCFVCVIEGGVRLDKERFADKVNLAIHRLDLHSSAGRKLEIRTAIGDMVRLFWRPGHHAMDALTQAHASAEDAAYQAEKNLDQIWYMGRSA